MDYVIPVPEPTLLPVESAGTFPVRRVHCVGRNYAEHTREMGGDPSKQSPIFFSKPTDAVYNGESLPYPPATNNLHYEVELVLALKSGGEDISEQKALDHIYGAAVGIDFTRRDRQAEAKENGQPWEIAKAFDYSGPIGAIKPGLPPQSGPIQLSVDNVLKQSADLSDMIWSSALIIVHLSKLVRLEAGDIIFTGTPSGVGPIKQGQYLHAKIGSLPELKLAVT